MSPTPFDQHYNFVIDHIVCLLSEAEDERRALLTRSVSLPRAWMGSLLIGLGRVLIGAGAWVGGQPTATWRM